MILCVCLNPAMDVTYAVPELVDGEAMAEDPSGRG